MGRVIMVQRPFVSGAALTSVSNVGTASSTSAVIAWPAVSAGDIAILFDYGNGFPAPTDVVPSGFTAMCEYLDAANRAKLLFKRCTGSESGNITGLDANVADKKALLILRGDVEIASAAGAGAQHGTMTNGNPSAITVPASGGTPPTLVIGLYNSTGTIDPRTFSTTKTGEASFHTNTTYIAWKLYTSSPGDSDIDMDDEGNTNLVQGFYLNLTV